MALQINGQLPQNKKDSLQEVQYPCGPQGFPLQTEQTQKGSPGNQKIRPETERIRRTKETNSQKKSKDHEKGSTKNGMQQVQIQAVQSIQESQTR